MSTGMHKQNGTVPTAGRVIHSEPEGETTRSENVHPAAAVSLGEYCISQQPYLKF